MSTEDYDRLSILYADAHKALAEASAIADLVEGAIVLQANTDSTLRQVAFLFKLIEEYAPHSVKVEMPVRTYAIKDGVLDPDSLQES